MNVPQIVSSLCDAVLMHHRCVACVMYTHVRGIIWGQLALSVGGGVEYREYPVATSSHLLRATPSGSVAAVRSGRSRTPQPRQQAGWASRPRARPHLHRSPASLSGSGRTPLHGNDDAPQPCSRYRQRRGCEWPQCARNVVVRLGPVWDGRFHLGHSTSHSTSPRPYRLLCAPGPVCGHTFVPTPLAPGSPRAPARARVGYAPCCGFCCPRGAVSGRARGLWGAVQRWGHGVLGYRWGVFVQDSALASAGGAWERCVVVHVVRVIS